MFKGYSPDDVVQLLVAGFETNDEELIVVALQAARTASVVPGQLSQTIAARCKRLGVGAAAAAGRHGEMDLLLRLLVEAGWGVRADVAMALGQVGGPLAREALTKAADDPDDWVQICAARALKVLPNRHQVKEIKDLTARAEGIAALILDHATRFDFEQLADLIDHSNKKVRQLAQAAIISGGTPARDHLFHALSRPGRPLKVDTISFLGKLGDPRAVKLLLDTVASGDAALSKEALAVLPGLDGLDDPSVVTSVADFFIAGVNGDSRYAPGALRPVLKAIGAAAAPALVRAFSEHGAVRRNEGRFIGQIAGTAAIPVLLTAFQDVSTDVQTGAADGLIAVGRAAIPELANLFDSPTSPLRIQREIVRVVAQIGDVAALPILLRSVKSDYRVVRKHAADGLVKIGRAAVPPLLDQLQSSPLASTRQVTIEVLSRIGDPRALGRLEAIIDSPASTTEESLLRDTAVRGLGGFRDDRTVQKLRRLVHDVRYQRDSLKALADLAKHGPYPDTLSALLGDLLSASSPEVRRMAFRILQEMWTQAEMPPEIVVTTLLPVLADPESDLVEAAIKHLASTDVDAERARGYDTNRFLVSRALTSATGVLRSRLQRALEAIDAAALEPKPIIASKERIGPAEPDPPPSPRLPFALTEAVRFSVSAPLSSIAGERFLLGVWVHRAYSEIRELARGQQRGQKTHVDSRGPVRLPSDVELTVRVSIPDYDVDGLTDTMYWSGRIWNAVGNCSFPIVVPAAATPGLHFGRASFRIGDIHVCTLAFALHVGAASQAADDVSCHEVRARRGFASYSAEDRERVMGRIQGMLRVLPDLDVFLDVISLRSGEKWAERVTEEILSRDAFFLFWSLAACKSKWVEHEWRTALQHKGLDAISPVPLDPPSQAPPPPELASLHFADFTLAFENFR